MDKQFELSAYGVEELNEEEIFLINGGVAVLAIVGVCVAVAGLVWAVYAHYDGQKVIATKMAPQPYMVIRADSIKEAADVTRIIYNPSVTVVPYRPEE